MNIEKKNENLGSANLSNKDDLTFLRADTLARLEWPRVAHALANECILPATQLKMQNFEPWINSQEREWIFSATEEVRTALVAGTTVTLSPFDFELVRAPLARQAVLSGPALYQIYTLTFLSKAAAEFVKQEKKRQASLASFPLLMELFLQIEPQPNLCEKLKNSVDAEGNLLPSASPELRSARARLESSRRKIVESLDSLLRKTNIKNALQDNVWMMRDGRYVLPVRVDCKGDIAGIPRGVSQSGSTVFVEPTELAGAQTQVEQATVDVQLEEARILRSLSELAASVRESLLAAAEILTRYDDLCARAKLSQKLDAQRPYFHKDRSLYPAFSFESARHPLFILESKPCSENDLTLTNEFSSSPEAQGIMPNIWVISGPNAGGKTVAMRTVGLLALMARAGLYVPADNPKIYEFDDIFVELGDRQSREDSLSTFSGHLLHLKKIIDLCSDRSLVLLDEGFVGTDPLLGSALARATLEFFANKNATVIITTHFSSLKTLADSDPRFLNASMEFEPTQLRPTYTLLNGLPGQSYALELATRLGFEPTVLKSALVYHGEEAQKLESLLADLQRKRADISDEIDRSRTLNAKLEKEISALLGERSTIENLRGTLVEGYRVKLQKRLNAFENRLEIRERQFERHKIELLENSTGQVLDKNLISKVQPISESEREKPRPVVTTASDFSVLAKFDFPVQSDDSRSFKLSKNLLSSSDNEARVRVPAKMTSRDLLDEARASLESLGKSFSTVEQDFEAEISVLSELQANSSARGAKTKEKIHQERTQNSTKPEKLAEFWQPKMRIKCPQWKEAGEVLKAVDSKGMVECLFGMIKAKVHHSSLIQINSGGKQNAAHVQSNPPIRKFVPTPKLAPPPPPQSKPIGPQTKNKLDMTLESAFPHGGNTVDLRGHLVDVAVEKLEQFMDRAWREDINPIVIIHGHGTGRIKAAVRDFLARASYSLKYRPGSSGEGGDGATVVAFQ